MANEGTHQIPASRYIKVRIIPQVTYRLECDGIDKGTFKFVDEWQGMKRYTNGSLTVVVDDPQNRFGSILERVFGGDPLEAHDAVVVKCSPEFLEKGKRIP